MSENSQPYHYVECGLSYVYLRNGFEIQNTPYGQGVVIHDTDGLHRCIGELLVDKPDSLTGAEFRFLRRELDLSQRILGELFDVDERSIRTWEREDKVPKLEDKLIRHMYKESLDPNSTFQGLIQRMKNLDVEWREQITLESCDSWRQSVLEA